MEGASLSIAGKHSPSNIHSSQHQFRQWSPTSSSTSTTVRKESVASRTPSIRKASRFTQVNINNRRKNIS